jgi:glycosyltransferase involved in cell wall biosynthesis
MRNTGARDRMSVLLTTEGTYPYHRGGVSTWCHALTHKLPDIDFTLFAVSMHPYLSPQYPLAANVRGVINVPLWGTEDSAEYGTHTTFLEYLRTRWSTTSHAVVGSFLPGYEALLTEIVAPARVQPLGPILLELHEHLRAYDYYRTQTAPPVWDAFVAIASKGWRVRYPDQPEPSLAELTTAWSLFSRLMRPLGVEAPRVDVTHSAAAAFCGLPCMVAKLKWGTPYLLTEHGVYLREQYLNLGRSVKSLFVRWFLFRLVSAIVDVNYSLADQVSPVCWYNTRWERWHGVDAKRIRVIYNGVDPIRFSPAPRTANVRPTVASVGLVFPLKGQIDLVEAAALVRRTIPNVNVQMYGSASDEGYLRECLARVNALDLQDHVTFAGTTTDPASVLRTADVVALPSISEAFPYALVEAMLSEAAIVATDVGGVREALGSTGVLVQPRDPEGLAAGIVALLTDPDHRAELGRSARSRALAWFTEQRFLEAYSTSYRQLVSATDQEVARGVAGVDVDARVAIA